MWALPKKQYIVVGLTPSKTIVLSENIVEAVKTGFISDTYTESIINSFMMEDVII